MDSPENSTSRYEKDRVEMLDIDVEMEEWSEAGKAKVIGTRGLSNCTGVIVSDEENQHAFVGHFSSPATDPIHTEMLNTIIERYQDVRSLKVYLGGAGPFDPEEIELYGDVTEIEERQTILDDLLKLGMIPENMYTQWSTQPKQVVAMSINTSTGIVTYDSVSIAVESTREHTINQVRIVGE
jgi:hypothetical protein